MTRNFTEENATPEVLARFDECPDPRLKEISRAVVTHLHALIRDLEPTLQEWMAALEFLTATGQKCDDTRQEFILLSDVWGVSTLVDAINNRKPGNATESTVLGPFHMVTSPAYENGADVALHGGREPLVVTGEVRGTDGRMIAGAKVDIWQADEDGFYDVQKPGEVPDRNLRGLFTTDEKGRFWFRSVLPCFYPIPTDGPVGKMVLATGRHPNRPAHIHFIGTADGYESVTSHLFVEGDPYIDSDVVFGVKESLISDFVLVDDPVQAAEFNVSNPFRHVHNVITLVKS
ncbi:MAG: 6-chlorohydroxyquinol-1,2-dioxygenase [Rhodospirillales bacterium]|nr:6-chlorohydroxyquinol-1,2-dioxygenase [Rhodospirillales bacterium]